jgi:predicted transposase YbfD/YdcC
MLLARRLRYLTSPVRRAGPLLPGGTSVSKVTARIEDHFAELTDPRRREGTYPLVNIVVMALCGVLSGADDFVAIAHWAETKKDWLAKFLDMSTGVPSHDRFNAIMGALRPPEFEKCLLSWMTALHEITDGQVIAIDGKTLRRSFDAAGSKAPIHMVSAWATANHISLGQVVTDAKSNEITAIPKLLQMLEIKGCLVTIDAMGCQREIAEKIVDQGADYVLAVKDNQPKLHTAIRDFFTEHLEDDCKSIACRRDETHEKGHGRKDDRYYYLAKLPEDFPLKAKWPGLSAIGMATRITEYDNGKTSDDTRYYIASRYTSGKKFSGAVRGHWGVENSLHWQLDVTFAEDQCRIRKGHADANFSLLRRTSRSLLKNNKSKKIGVKNKRLVAAWNDGYRIEVLCGK